MNLRPLLAVAAVLLASAPGRADDAWLAQPDVPREKVTAELSAVWALPPDQAAARADALKPWADKGSLPAALLAAVAVDRAGKADDARAAYDALAAKDPTGPYGTSAAVRALALSTDAEREKTLQEIADDADGADRGGWFLSAGRWAWDTRPRGALRALLDARPPGLPGRVLRYLYDRAPFPPEYAYLFPLLVLTVAARVVTLPFTIKTAKFAIAFKELRPEVEYIKRRNGDDVLAAQREIGELLRRNNLSPLAGCAQLFLDIVFVVVALVALAAFVPQIRLDHGRFLWLDDVTRYDTAVVLLVVAVLLVISVLSGQTQQQQDPGQLACSGILAGAVIAAAAWKWDWPAYGFVFWGLLSVVGFVVGRTIYFVINGLTARR